MVYLPIVLSIIAHLYILWLITQAYDATNIRRRQRIKRRQQRIKRRKRRR